MPIPPDEYASLRDRVTRLEERLDPIRKIVYGMVATIGVSLVAALMALLLK